MWRDAHPGDDPAIIEMCLNLNREDPGPHPVSVEHVKRTLAELRTNPVRGKALVLELDGHAEGYALLISFWSNEYGGEVCNIDEIYIHPMQRKKGHGKELIRSLLKTNPFWPRRPALIELEVSPQNRRARALYKTLGFRPSRNMHMQFCFADE